MKDWKCCGRKVPQTEIVYFSQIIILYLIIIMFIFNLTYKNENKDLWLALLTYCLGCLLPSPVTIYGSLGGLPQTDLLQSISSRKL